MGFQRKALWVSLAAAWVLAGCGGGGSDTEPLAPVKTIKVMGDSLADSGTFGLKFTVQGAAPTGAGSTAIWPERIASSYGTTLCPRYVFTGTAFNNASGCTNYAVGGGRINNFTAPTSPVSITQQISDAGAEGWQPRRIVGQPVHRHHAVGFNIGFIDPVQTVAVAQLIPARRVGVV